MAWKTKTAQDGTLEMSGKGGCYKGAVRTVFVNMSSLGRDVSKLLPLCRVISDFLYLEPMVFCPGLSTVLKATSPPSFPVFVIAPLMSAFFASPSLPGPGPLQEGLRSFHCAYLCVCTHKLEENLGIFPQLSPM